MHQVITLINSYSWLILTLWHKLLWNVDTNVFFASEAPDNKVHEANMGPTWVLSAPDGPHVGPWTLLSGAFDNVFILRAFSSGLNVLNRQRPSERGGLVLINVHCILLLKLCSFININISRNIYSILSFAEMWGIWYPSFRYLFLEEIMCLFLLKQSPASGYDGIIIPSGPYLDIKAVFPRIVISLINIWRT